MLAGLERSQDEAQRLAAEAPPREAPTEKPRAHFVETLEDAKRLRDAANASEVSEHDLVFFGEEVSTELGISDRPVPPGSLVMVAGHPKKEPPNK
jgi:hypothetical protein